MKILAIETSCDETSIAILEHTQHSDQNSFRVLSHVTLSQIDVHRQYGGVYPNAARREHQLNIVPVLHQALEKAGMLQESEVNSTTNFAKATMDKMYEVELQQILNRESDLMPILKEFLSTHEKPDIDCIAITTGPGLEPALWVGVNFARALAHVWSIPVVAVNHMEGHIFSVFATGPEFSIPEIQFPAMALLISGGHTEIIQMSQWNNYEKIGSTVDDAVGEAFDKVARLLGLPYPGGPEISRLAAQHEQDMRQQTLGNRQIQNPNGVAPVSRLESNVYSLPRPMLHSGDLNFSFSGLKTAVRYLIDKLTKPLDQQTINAIAYEFETAVTEVLVSKTHKAIQQIDAQTIIVGGGVSANKRIRSSLTQLCEKHGVSLHIPTGVLAMDNALMIGVVGALKFVAGHTDNPDDLRADGNWSL